MQNNGSKTKIFISYAVEDKDTALKLYRDLKDESLNPWIDENDLLPGQKWRETITQVMKTSEYVLVLFSSKSVKKRGFAQKEMKMALDLLDEFSDDEIFVIPVQVDECEIPFRLEHIHKVDLFPSYEAGLNKILRVFESSCGIGPEMNLDESEFINELFEKFYTRQAVLLLGQRDREQGQAKDELIGAARNRFGADNVLSVVPLRDKNAAVEDYFEYIGGQCGADEPVKNGLGFMKLIQKLLAEKGELFLLISGFERGSAEGGKALAGVLRNLMDSYSANLKVMVCGGQRLADLYFVSGREFSFLNSAEAVEWPELTENDVRRLCKNQDMDENTEKEILELSGGHPRLLQLCLDFCQKQGQFNAGICKDSMKKDHYIWHLFTEFLGRETQEKVYELLGKDEVWPYQPYIIDSLVRRLYWQNLLKRSLDQKQLVWRGEIIKRVGKQVLGNT